MPCKWAGPGAGCTYLFIGRVRLIAHATRAFDLTAGIRWYSVFAHSQCTRCEQPEPRTSGGGSVKATLIFLALLGVLAVGFLAGILFVIWAWWDAWRHQHPMSDAEVAESLRPVTAVTRPSREQARANGGTHARD